MLIDRATKPKLAARNSNDNLIEMPAAERQLT
jgi:hypothetical protein